MRFRLYFQRQSWLLLCSYGNEFTWRHLLEVCSKHIVNPIYEKIPHSFVLDIPRHSHTLPKDDKKITWHTTRVLLTSEFFRWDLSIFIISGNTDRNCILVNFAYFFDLYWVSQGCFNQHDAALMFLAKLAISGLLKVRFWNKGNDVIISLHDVTTKFYHVFNIIL